MEGIFSESLIGLRSWVNNAFNYKDRGGTTPYKFKYMRSFEYSPENVDDGTKKFRDILQNAIDTSRKIIFVSPHPDDAVLSAGQLLSSIASKAPVTVATVFTSFENNNPSNSWMAKCGFTDASMYFAYLKQENSQALGQLGVTSIKDLGFAGTSWRDPLSEEGIRSLKDKILGDLEYLTKGDSSALLFAPVSLGRGHLDHHVITDLITTHFPQVLLWKEYQVGTKKTRETQSHNIPEGLSRAQWIEGNKEQAILAYKSQLTPLFPNRVIEIPGEEYYFDPKKI